MIIKFVDKKENILQDKNSPKHLSLKTHLNGTQFMLVAILNWHQVSAILP
jgi:hypothetical protein